MFRLAQTPVGADVLDGPMPTREDTLSGKGYLRGVEMPSLLGGRPLHLVDVPLTDKLQFSPFYLSAVEFDLDRKILRKRLAVIKVDLQLEVISAVGEPVGDPPKSFVTLYGRAFR